MARFIYCICFILSYSLLSAQSEPETITEIKSRIADSENPEDLVGLYNDIAWEYSFSTYDSAEKYALVALELSKEINNNYWLAVSTEMMALLKEISGQPEEALKLYFEVIEIREQIGGQGLENTFNNLAILFKSQKNFKKALEYFNKSYQIELQKENENGIVGSLINMGIALKDVGMRDSSIVLLRKALIHAKKINDNHLINNAYINIAGYHEILENYDSALFYNNLILERVKQSNNIDGLTSALMGVASINFKLKKYHEALKNLDQAEVLALQKNVLEYLKRIYGLKKEIYNQLGDLTQAYDYQEKYIAANDSLLNIETVTVINELEKKYETAQQEKQITQLELDNQTAALRLEQSVNERNIFIFISLIVLMLAAFIAYLFYSKGKLNRLLENKNQTIQSALNEKEVLLKEIHHRVKNNLQIISSLLNLQSRHIKDKAASDAIKEGKNRVKSMAMIHQKLYQKDNLTGIEMEDYLHNLTDSLFDSYGVDRNQIKLNLQVDTIRLDVDTTIPLGLIVNELISNTLKHAFEPGKKGVINIEFQKHKEILRLKVADNGKGLTSKANEHSFGLQLIDSLAKKLKATTSIDSTKGTCYIVEISKFKVI